MTLAELERFYSSGAEDARLAGPLGQLEFARTLEIVQALLPPPPARIVDVGGGTGPYARALAALGYELHLLDAVPLHVEIALQRGGLASATHGDARRLPWPGAFADAALLLGPLYHLPDEADRRQALLEIRRVLKRGAPLAAAAISRSASLIDGLRAGFVEDPTFQAIVLADLDGGLHRNPANHPAYFTTARFHSPQELAAELTAAGFEKPQLHALQGLFYLDPRFDHHWRDPALRPFILETLRRTAQDPATLGASPHLLATARRV